MFTLFGSTTSPYVRRLRMWMHDKSFNFSNVDIFGEQDRAKLKAVNPTLKIPMLDHNGTVIFDSGVIHRYVAKKQGERPLSVEQENLLTVIDAANDSLVQLLILHRSGYDLHEDKMYFTVQHERVAGIFAFLDTQLQAGQFENWDYLAVSLYCLADWARFRELHDLSQYPAIMAFLDAHSKKPEVIATDPRD